MSRFTVISATALAVAVAAASVVAVSQSSPPVPAEVAGPDLLAPAATRHVLAARAGSVGAAAAGPSAEDVGDADSFGRAVQFLGLMQGDLRLADDCTGVPTSPTSQCQVLAPAPAFTPFNLQDLAHVTLPGKSAKSLLCYWLSPVLQVRYANPGATPVIARLAYSPTLTVESPVLDDPALIDPTTGAPFGGRLTTGMTASERFEVALPAGVALTERARDSAVCIAGFLTRRSLVELYGLSDAQAKEVFKQPLTVRLNLTGSVQHVQDASLIFGLRIVGD